MYGKIFNRHLHERSNLTFEFPGPNGKITRAFVPFLENCEVSESQKSNLAEYSLLSRSGSIFSYLGAKARTISLNFKITLPHVSDTLGLEGVDQRFKQIQTNTQTEDPKTLFLIKNISNQATNSSIGKNYALKHAAYYKKLPFTSQSQVNFANLEEQNPYADLVQYVPGEDTGIFQNLFGGDEIDINTIQQKDKTINLIIYWINLVRSSTKNNSQNTIYGCPIIRLTHGPIFNNVPCIVESYSIKVNQEIGYDVDTLFPKQFDISMSLVEQRTGDFGKFESGQPITGDNITGWESVIEGTDMDPYNGII